MQHTSGQLQGLGSECHVHNCILEAGSAAKGKHHAQLAHLPDDYLGSEVYFQGLFW